MPALEDAMGEAIEAMLRSTVKDKKELERKLRNLEVLRPVYELMASLRQHAPPGDIRCVAKCNGGKIIFNPNPCKPCDGDGSVKCKICKGKATSDCRVCAGEREVHMVCPQCLGGRLSFKLLDRTLEDMNACPWCNGAHILTCSACDEEGNLERSCRTCAATGNHLCASCAGTKKIRCRSCSGTGLRGVRNNKCDKCKGKGTSDCLECKKGVVTCVTCKGAKRETARCEHCYGSMRALCPGCRSGSSRAWIETAEQLLDLEGHEELAVAHLRHAITRGERNQLERLRRFQGTDMERKAYERDLKKELTPLRKRLKRAEKEIK